MKGFIMYSIPPDHCNIFLIDHERGRLCVVALYESASKAIAKHGRAKLILQTETERKAFRCSRIVFKDEKCLTGYNGSTFVISKPEGNSAFQHAGGRGESSFMVLRVEDVEQAAELIADFLTCEDEEKYLTDNPILSESEYIDFKRRPSMGFDQVLVARIRCDGQEMSGIFLTDKALAELDDGCVAFFTNRDDRNVGGPVASDIIVCRNQLYGHRSRLRFPDSSICVIPRNITSIQYGQVLVCHFHSTTYGVARFKDGASLAEYQKAQNA